MLEILVAVFISLWALGSIATAIMIGLIYILVIIAVIAIIMILARIIKGKRL